ncbi:mannose-1-phosphate guanylyltransferase/mannose-6-phosphate isomerase [Paenibacillus elgii]|uniref:mannose-1-phosphate guanylyltransferase n=1 Tax=Paenibacillus elgii TaxID=189691 RepID=A0A2T6G6X6_9BACL|nr:mannose-1-phosphate guanylyltransferase/mannose-6-phosphate isomerase [Paenibacillus elgii]PUA39901.1 mannose-1-phosphate guanylyltransferase/mannose-6-phosphate isomerase [Paenibacillus elgii]
MINIVLCGGSGTRLWPLSRTLYPKQFYKLFEDTSSFQKTILRNKNICNSTLIVSNEEQFFLAMDQLEEVDFLNSTFLLEPIGRNTAPAIALACMNIDHEEIVLVTPSDHFIESSDKYREGILKAAEFAKTNSIVIFGIKPSYPETGFGYIEALGENVVSFIEKPDLSTAQKYIQRKNYFWNSGMFVFKAGVFLKELQQYSPDIYEACAKAYMKAKKNEKITRILSDDMIEIPSNSIDYAVIEKSRNVKFVPLDVVWSDLGSFEALDEHLKKTQDGNTDNDNNFYINSHNNLVIANEKLITTIDVEGLVIVDTPDALLITKKGSSHKVKEVVSVLAEKKSYLTQSHLTSYRSWGNSTVLEKTNKFKIKKVVVKPGAKLSKQKHYHRNEHWIILSGTAKVTIGMQDYILRTNESTYIPMGIEHQVENPGKIVLTIIEVQVGDYLEEDDIVRIDS